MRTRAYLLLSVLSFAASLPTYSQEPSLERAEEPRVASALTNVSRGDRQFLQLAIDRGAKEVQFSQRALDKIQNAKVKAFAQQIIEDHSALNKELMALNERLLGDEGPPFKTASATVEREVKQLDKLTGVEFDRRYMQVMMKDHQASIELFSQEAERGQDPKLRALAKETLPLLQAHQKTAGEIWDELRRGAQD